MAFDIEELARLSANDAERQWGESSFMGYARNHADEIVARLRAADAMADALDVGIGQCSEDARVECDTCGSIADCSMRSARAAHDAARKEKP